MTITERLHAKMKNCEAMMDQCRKNLAALAPQADARHDEAVQKMKKEPSEALEHVRDGMFAAGEYCRALSLEDA